MNKPTSKKIHISKLVVNKALNVRLPDNYDLESMDAAILREGRIIVPLVVTDDGTVLRGNRRALSGQRLYEDPNTPEAVKKALESVECQVYSGLTEEEKLRLVCDHGDNRGLNRTELVLAVWKLAKQMFGENQIIELLFYSIADYTGNKKKLKEVPTEPKARLNFLRTWLHGTVGNRMLAVLRMPEYVRQEYILTHLAEDGLLKPDQKVTVRVTGTRIQALTSARSADEKAKVWDSDAGGPAFRELWEKFVAEDAGQATGDTPAKRHSRETLIKMADQFSSAVVKKSLLAAAGEPQSDLPDLDTQMARLTKVESILLQYVDRINDPTVKGLIQAMVRGNTDELSGLLEKVSS